MSPQSLMVTVVTSLAHWASGNAPLNVAAFQIAAQFSSVQDGIYALRKAHMRSTPSFRSFLNVNNNNNEYLERLTRTGPKRLHVLYKYIFVKIQCIQHERCLGNSSSIRLIDDGASIIQRRLELIILSRGITL